VHSLYLSLSYPVETKIFIFLSPDRRNWNRGSCNTQIFTPKMTHHLHHSYSISIAWLCVIYVSLTHLWKTRWNVCSSCAHTLGFFSKHSGKGPIKDWHDPQHLKVATRIKRVLLSRINQKIAQLQDSWTSRTSAVQIRVFDRLKPPEGNFHLRMSQYLKIWFNMLKRTPRVHSQVHN
jgi:hypothetical protein